MLWVILRMYVSNVFPLLPDHCALIATEVKEKFGVLPSPQTSRQTDRHRVGPRGKATQQILLSAGISSVVAYPCLPRMQVGRVHCPTSTATLWLQSPVTASSWWIWPTSLCVQGEDSLNSHFLGLECLQSSHRKCKWQKTILFCFFLHVHSLNCKLIPTVEFQRLIYLSVCIHACIHSTRNHCPTFPCQSRLSLFTGLFSSCPLHVVPLLRWESSHGLRSGPHFPWFLFSCASVGVPTSDATYLFSPAHWTILQQLISNNHMGVGLRRVFNPWSYACRLGIKC